MANNIIKRTWKQGGMVGIEDLRGLTFQNEALAHTFKISGVDADGSAIALSGTPAGVMLRADNMDVALTCALSDGCVTASLPAECYDVPGRAEITIYLTEDGHKVCIYAAIVSVNRTSSGTASPGTAADVVDLVNLMQTSVDAAADSATAAAGSATSAAASAETASAAYNVNLLAPNFVQENPYPAGQHVIYDGGYYVLPNGHEADVTWANTSKTQLTVGGELTDLKSAVNYSSVPVIWDENGDGKYLNASGEVGTDADMHYSALLHVIPGSALLSFDFSGSKTVRVHGYDCFGNWLNQIYYQSVTTSQKWTLTIPDNVAYIRLSMPKSATNISLFIKIIDELESVRNQITYKGTEEISWAVGSDGSTIGENGTVTTSTGTTNFHYSNLIKVFTGEGCLSFSYSGTTTTLRIHGYDKDGKWVKQIKAVSNISSDRVIYFDITSDVVYIRFAMSKSISNISLSFAHDNNPLVFDEIKRIGSSENAIINTIPFVTIPVTWDANGDGKYITSNGSISTDSSMHYSDLLPSYKGSASIRFDLSGVSRHIRIHGYNGVGVWVREIADFDNQIKNGTLFDFVLPDDVDFIRISMGKNTSNVRLLETIPNGIDKALSYSTFAEQTVLSWEIGSTDKFIDANGNIKSSSGMHYSTLVPVRVGKGCLRFGYSGSEKVVRIHGYDKNGLWVKQLSYVSATTDTERPFIIPEDVYYIRVSIPSAATSATVETVSYNKQATEQIEKRIPEIAEKYKLRVSSLGRIDDEIDSEVEDGTYFSLCGYRYQLVDGSPSFPVGWLYQRSPTADDPYSCELWYSANQIDKPKLLTTMIGFGPSSNQRPFEISPTHGDIITCQRDYRNAPYVYDASTGETVEITGLSTNPIGWTECRGGEFALDGNGNEFFMFGEYTGISPELTGNLNIWKVTYPYTEPENWNIVFSMERASDHGAQESGKPWHVHMVMRDPYTGIWYLTTGDQDTAIVWYYSTDDGENWTRFHIGTDWDTQISRANSFVFTKDYIWWASDWGTNHSINRMGRAVSGIADISTHERVAELNKNQSTYAVAYLNYPNGLLMFDNVDSSFEENTDDITVQFYSLEDGKVYNLKTFRRLPAYLNEAFGFRCLCYTLRQSPYDNRIGIGFNASNVNKLDMDGNVQNGLCTLFFELT